MKNNKIKSENLNILENWYKPYKDFKKLNFSESRKLYYQMLDETDKKTKENLREELIYGTMYQIYDFLKESSFINFKSPSYTMDDIIDECINIWIDYIDNGRFNETKSFWNFSSFNHMILKLSNTLLKNTKLPVFNYSISHESFIDIYKWYFNLKNRGEDINYQEFEKIIRINFIKNQSAKKEDLINLYTLLSSYYNYCVDNDINNELIDKKEKFMRDFLLDIGQNYQKQNVQNIKANDNDDMLEIMIDEDLINSMRELLNVRTLKPYEKTILEMKYGFYDRKYTVYEISECLNLSLTTIRIVEKKALMKLQNLIMNHSKNKSNKFLDQVKSYTKY